MTHEKIEKIASKFNGYCSIAEERYDEPKYVFAALLTMLDFLEEKECRENDEKKECLENEENKETKEAIPSHITLLGVHPQSEFEMKILKDLINLGCESLEEIKGVRGIVDQYIWGNKWYVMVKSRLARLPDYWNRAAIGALSTMMREKNLTLNILN